MQQERSAKPTVSPEMRQQIDENLKRVYTAAKSEEVPDRFTELLAQLRAKEEGQ